MVGTVQPQLKVPNVADNPDGWGPPEGFVMLENQLQNVPYAPFSKNERIGRVADWTRNYNARPNARSGQESSVFDFVFDEADEESFRLVDGKPPPKPRFGPRWRFQQQRQLPQRKDEEVEAKKREAEKERQRRDRFYHQNRNNMQRREAAVFKSSVDIQPEWTMLDQIPFTTFSKLSYSVGEPEDLVMCGALEYYIGCMIESHRRARSAWSVSRTGTSSR